MKRNLLILSAEFCGDMAYRTVKAMNYNSDGRIGKAENEKRKCSYGFYCT